jgi:hypothetical protein
MTVMSHLHKSEEEDKILKVKILKKNLNSSKDKVLPKKNYNTDKFFKNWGLNVQKEITKRYLPSSLEELKFNMEEAYVFAKKLGKKIVRFLKILTKESCWSWTHLE